MRGGKVQCSKVPKSSRIESFKLSHLQGFKVPKFKIPKLQSSKAPKSKAQSFEVSQMIIQWFRTAFWWFSDGCPIAFLLCSYGFPIVSEGFPSVFLWLSYSFPMVFPLISYGVRPVSDGFPMIVIWFSACFPMVFCKCSYGAPVVCPLFFHGFLMVPLTFQWISIALPLVFL